MGEATVSERVGDLFSGLLDGLFGNPVVQSLWMLIAGYTVVLWVAAAWWTLQDMRRRNEDPALPYLAAGMVVLASPALFPLALIVYGILRPAETLADARYRELEEVLDELDPLESGCPGCRRSIEPSWLSCPACRTRLGYRCVECGQTMELDWSVCAWCAAEFGQRPARVPARPAVAAASATVAAVSQEQVAGPWAAAAVSRDRDAVGNGTGMRTATVGRKNGASPSRRGRGQQPGGRTSDRDSETVRSS